MKALVIDTAGELKRISFVRDDLLVDEVCFQGDLQTCFWPKLEGLLQKNRLHLKEFDRFAVNCGPGSWTGLRFGLAVVKGWAAAGGQKVVAFPAGSQRECGVPSGLFDGEGLDPAAVEAVYGRLPRFKKIG